MPVPEPGPGQVLVKVGGAGACHSDLHLLEAPAGSRSFTLPFTLGHENAGWVETMGQGATGFSPGDPVIVYGPWGCGLCMNCRTGMENYCESPGKPSPGGLGGTDGGMAEYLLVPSTRYLIPLGDLDPLARPPHGRGADQLPRRETLGASARAGLDRGGHRRRRARADGDPGA